MGNLDLREEPEPLDQREWRDTGVAFLSVLSVGKLSRLSSGSGCQRRGALWEVECMRRRDVRSSGLTGLLLCTSGDCYGPSLSQSTVLDQPHLTPAASSFLVSYNPLTRLVVYSNQVTDYFRNFGNYRKPRTVLKISRRCKHVFLCISHPTGSPPLQSSFPVVME